LSPVLADTFGPKAGPSITSLTANDPDGGDAIFGDGDTITVVFSEATNEPEEEEKADLDKLFTFSQSLGTDYTGSFTDELTLLITIVDSTGSAPPAVGVFRVTVKESGNLKDKEETSLASVAVSPVLGGNFGQKAGPSILLIVAADPKSTQIPEFDKDDTITIRFSEVTNRPLAGTKADIDKVFLFKQGGQNATLGTDYVGSWISPSVLEIRMVDASGATPPEVGALTLEVLTGGNLRNGVGTSLSSNATSLPLIGSFGQRAGPTIISLIADDPGAVTAGFSAGDTITIRFSEPTNRPAVATKANIDALLSFSESLSDDYTGQFTNPLTLKITITDATIDSPPEVGVFRVTVKAGGNLKDKKETSLASVAVSPLLDGSFGQEAGPAIKSIVALDPFGKNVGFGNDDTITINFLEATNEPFKGALNNLTKANVDAIFTFSQSLGTSYTGTWLDPNRLEITITDTSGSGSPAVDVFRVIVKKSGNLKNAAETSRASVSESSPLEGNFGKKAGPTIAAIIARDPDSADAIFSADDTITVLFSEATNQPFFDPNNPAINKTNIDALFTFSQDLGADYSGIWINPFTLRITIDNPSGATPPVVGVLTTSVKPTSNLKNAAETSETSISTSPGLIGSFSLKAGPGIKSVVVDDPDDGDSVYSIGDTITIRFVEPTNQPKNKASGLTRADLDSIFTYTQNIGDDYTGEWLDSMTVRITINDATTDRPPQIGEMRVIVKESANLKSATGASLASGAVSPTLTGKFGTFTEIIPTTEGATATTTLPIGITSSLTIPSGQNNTLTMQRTELTTSLVGPLITVIRESVVEITPDQNTTPCSEAGPCPVEFIFNIVDAQAIAVDPFAVKILHDKKGTLMIPVR